MTMAVRSIGATVNLGALGPASPACGGSDDTAMSTLLLKKSARDWFDEVFVTLRVRACAPLQRSAAHW